MEEHLSIKNTGMKKFQCNLIDSYIHLKQLRKHFIVFLKTQLYKSLSYTVV
jgi:hypothetical protein